VQSSTGNKDGNAGSSAGNDVLIVSRDVIGERVAGPGVRYLEMARQLSARHRVTLMAPGLLEAPGEGRFRVEPLSRSGLQRGLSRAAVVISQGFAYSAWSMSTTRAAQVFDLYAPLQLEMLEAGQEGHASEREAAFYRRFVARRLRLLMAHGDFFICASQRQRDLWLGQLTAAGRINRANFARDAGLRELIDCVPFGTPTKPFPGSGHREENCQRARQHISGVSEDDFLLLWGGGIWPWLDPATAIRATVLAAKKRPEVKLLFLGSGHPNPGVTTGQGAGEQARHLAAELGVLGQTVLFNEQWVPFEKRVDFLAAADAGLLAHHPGIETRFAFRTRLLDCFWAGLPVLSTAGDELSALAAENGAGISVPPGDPEALAEAIVSMAGNGVMREEAGSASANLGEHFRWDRVFAPLERFVEQPHTRHSRGEKGAAFRSRRSAVNYSVAVAALGARYGLWRRALRKLLPVSGQPGRNSG
jgi:glycosyltransferase involved in cell wall biosynthesis